MTIKIQQRPHVWVDFNLIGPGGEDEGPARFKCRAMRREEFDVEVAKPTTEFVRGIVEDWGGFDEPFSADTLAKMLSVFPSAAVQITREYTKALFATARKN